MGCNLNLNDQEHNNFWTAYGSFFNFWTLYASTKRSQGKTVQRLHGGCSRDYALLRLLWGNALRRGEISLTNIGDFDFKAKTMKIVGKGSGGEKQKITLPPKSAIAPTISR